MRRTELPISDLPAWALLNNVSFYDISLHSVGGKGFGFIADRALSSDEALEIPELLRVPRDLILSAETIERHARVDEEFCSLLKVAGGVVWHSHSPI